MSTMNNLILTVFTIRMASYGNSQILPWYPRFSTPFLQSQFYQVPQPLQSFLYQTPTYYQAPQINTQFFQRPVAPTPKPGNQDDNPPAPSSDDYRGFGYHTLFQNGASSTVIFFRGAGAGVGNIPRDTITIASDGQDPQASKALSTKIAKSLQETLTSRSSAQSSSSSRIFGLTPVVEAFIENPQPLSGVIHFYSQPGYPASTTPLSLARIFNTTISNRTVSTNSIKEEDEKETAESIVTSLRFNSNNELGDNITASTSTVSTTTSTEAVVSSTETSSAASSESPVEATTETPKATTIQTTANNEEAVTTDASIETTTV